MSTRRYKVLTLNNISARGLARLPRERYDVGSEVSGPDGILHLSVPVGSASEFEVAVVVAPKPGASGGSPAPKPPEELGWPPGYGIAQLTALVGKARALELCLKGEPITAAVAHEWGLVNAVVPGATLWQQARGLAARLIELPAHALRETKRLIHADEGQLPKVTHRADTEAYVRCLELPDAQEGMAAFAEKRKPRFRGK